MKVAGVDACDAARETGDDHRSKAAVSRAVPQASKIVGSPALNIWDRREHAGVLVAASNGNRLTTESRHRHGLGTVLGLAVAQLAYLVRPPAFDRTRVQHRAGVVFAGGNRADAAVEADDGNRSPAVIGLAVAQLAAEVGAPDMTPPALVSAQVNCPFATIALTPLSRPDTATGAGLSLFVPSPNCPLTFQPQHSNAAGGRQSTRMGNADGQCLDSAFKSRYGNRCRAVIGRAIAQLAAVVHAPALDSACARNYA